MFADVDLQLNLGFEFENIVFTNLGFDLNSGFTKILCTPIFPLPNLYIFSFNFTASKNHPTPNLVKKE